MFDVKEGLPHISRQRKGERITLAFSLLCRHCYTMKCFIAARRASEVISYQDKHMTPKGNNSNAANRTERRGGVESSSTKLLG